MSVVEEFSGIDVDDMLQLRKRKQVFVFFVVFCFVFFTCFCICVRSGLAIGICCPQ